MNAAKRRFAVTLALGLAGLLASSAAPRFHVTDPRGPRGPTRARATTSMLQMTADGQNTWRGTTSDFLSADGMADGDMINCRRGSERAEPARRCLIGNTGVSGADCSDAGCQIVNQTDGAVCLSTHGGYDGTGGFDCVAWGDFIGRDDVRSLRRPGDMPADSALALATDLQSDHLAGLRDGARCRRRHDNSAADFSLGTGHPRNNAVPDGDALHRATGAVRGRRRSARSKEEEARRRLGQEEEVQEEETPLIAPRTKSRSLRSSVGQEW